VRDRHTHPRNTFSAGLYPGDGTRAHPRRWAVYCAQTSTWYFPKVYGMVAAERLTIRLNKHGPASLYDQTTGWHWVKNTPQQEPT
jgi:hypothetical protein